MEPKLKAKELVEKFWHLDEECEIEEGFEHARKCALICIDQILDLIGVMKQGQMILSYWLEVKQEIKKL